LKFPGQLAQDGNADADESVARAVFAQRGLKEALEEFAVLSRSL